MINTVNQKAKMYHEKRIYHGSQTQTHPLDRIQGICYNDHNGIAQSYNYAYTATGAIHSVEAAAGGRLYLYNYDSKGRLIGYTECDGDSALVQNLYLYDESGAPIGLQYRTKSYAANVFDTFYFEKNLQGDIVAIYNASGEKIGSYTYDAWGNCTVTVVSENTTLEKNVVRSYNPFRYRGYYYDTETGLYYLQSRYYNPVWGRFLNADGYVNANGDLIGFNMYAYCSSNPVNYVDYSGEDAVYYWASTLPIVGHAAVFIETSNGWYLIQFAPETGWNFLKAMVCIEHIGSYNEVLERINLRKDSKYIYMCGDFTESYSTAYEYSINRNSNGYDKKYNPFSNNCLHLVLDLLSQGSFVNPKVKKFIDNYSGFVPIDFYNKLSSITSTKARPVRGGITQETCCIKE